MTLRARHQSPDTRRYAVLLVGMVFTGLPLSTQAQTPVTPAQTGRSTGLPSPVGAPVATLQDTANALATKTDTNDGTLASGTLSGLTTLSGTLSGTSVYGDLNLQSDGLRYTLGTLPLSYEVGGQNHPSTSAIVGATVVPAGAYSGPDTWPDAGAAFYCLNGNTTKSCAAIYTLAGVSVSGSFVEGINASTVNCALLAVSCTATTGLDFRFQTTSEFDTNLYSLSGAQPTGPVRGVVSQLNATIQTSNGVMDAFDAIGNSLGMPPVAWKAGFVSNVGAAPIAFLAGPVAVGASQNSQQLVFTAVNSSSAALTAAIFEDVSGALNLVDSVASSTLSLAVSYPQLAFSQTVVGGPSGLRLRNSGTGTGTTENLRLETGTANSFATFQLTDANGFNLMTGSGNPGIAFTPGTGSVKLNGPAILAANVNAPALPVCGSAGLVSGDVCKTGANVLQVTP